MENQLAELLREHAYLFHSVVPFNWKKEPVLVLNLTDANEDLRSVDLTSTVDFDAYVSRKMQEAGARVAVGGYNENRCIYRRSAHFQQSDEPRSIHLGIDIWAAAGTHIFAPLEGRVHSFQHNNNFGDYGPTLILEHQLENTVFYTLYGHLTPESIEGIRAGQKITEGEPIAEIGNFPDNGDWPPHLHFQIIADLQGYAGDYPGVCKPSEREQYLRNCPDANLILQIPVLSPSAS